MLYGLRLYIVNHVWVAMYRDYDLGVKNIRSY
jgi:hypothetical protein